MATRAEIHRRKVLAERLARMMCKWDRRDPDKPMISYRRSNGHHILKPLWEQYRPEARRILAQQDWPEIQPRKDDDAQES